MPQSDGDMVRCLRPMPVFPRVHRVLVQPGGGELDGVAAEAGVVRSMRHGLDRAGNQAE